MDTSEYFNCKFTSDETITLRDPNPNSFCNSSNDQILQDMGKYKQPFPNQDKVGQSPCCHHPALWLRQLDTDSCRDDEDRDVWKYVQNCTGEKMLQRLKLKLYYSRHFPIQTLPHVVVTF